MQFSSFIKNLKIYRLWGVIILSVAYIFPQSAYASICEAELIDAFKRLETPGKTVRGTTFVNYAGNDTGGSTTDSADSWTSFNECNGNLVIRVDDSCFMKTAYTTGTCKIKDIPKY